MTKLLILEDETRLSFYLSVLLQGEGYEVHACSTSSEAMKIVSHFVPDILIADWLLKDKMNGMALAREIRKTSPGMRIIIISGLPVEDLKKQTEEGEVYAFIAKPFDYGDLEATVKSAIAERSEAMV